MMVKSKGRPQTGTSTNNRKLNLFFVVVAGNKSENDLKTLVWMQYFQLNMDTLMAAS